MGEETRLYSVKLTAQELMLLNDKCSSEVQKEVDTCMEEAALRTLHQLPSNIAAMVVKITDHARNNGKLTYTQVMIKDCPCCGRNEGYYVHARDKYTKVFGNRMLTTRKGDPNYDNPRLFMGYDIGRGNVVMKNRIWVGYCDNCAPMIESVLKVQLASIAYQHPDGWLGMTTRFKYYDKRKCMSCGWIGGENEMGKKRTLMGDGWYPGSCPKCSAESLIFGPTVFDIVKGFVLVPVEKGETNG